MDRRLLLQTCIQSLKFVVADGVRLGKGFDILCLADLVMDEWISTKLDPNETTPCSWLILYATLPFGEAVAKSKIAGQQFSTPRQ